MPDPSLVQAAILSLASSAAMGVATFVTMTRRHALRIAALTKRVADLEIASRAARASFDSAFAKIDQASSDASAALSTAQRAAARPRLQSVPDIGAIVDAHIQRVVLPRVDAALRDAVRALEEVGKLRTLAEHAMTRAQFAQHVEAEAERWAEVHRALGVIEGTLHGVRDQLRGPR